MLVARFPAYRDYNRQRREVNNAIMALLAGAGLAAHTLQLTRGSEHLLPEVFPAVPHIGRFNLTSAAATDILVSADTHLSAMSVPYILSLHESFLKECIRLLVRAELVPSSKLGTSLAGQHQVIAEATTLQFPISHLQILGTVRDMRNCLIHDGSVADTALQNGIAEWSAETNSTWRGFGGSELSGIRAGDRIQFGMPALIATLATTKALSRRANSMLVTALPRPTWVGVLADDASTRQSEGQVQAEQFAKHVQGVARFHYSAMDFTKADIEMAVELARRH